MLETVGTQLRRARTARDLSLEDAARATKIRASRLGDLEADVYTNFPNLAYARGFLTSYGKYLAVNVRPYLDAFENTSTFGVDDYQYLSEKPVGVYRAPRRVWRQRAPRKRLVALGSTLGLMMVMMFGWFLYINYLRLGDLNKLAEHQNSRPRPSPELTPAALLAKPIPSETPNPVAPPSLLTPREEAPLATQPPAVPQPTEIAMMEKAIAPPPAAAALPVPLAPKLDADSAATQLIENRLATARPAVAVATHRASARPGERAGRVSFDTTAPQPPPRAKSFE